MKEATTMFKIQANPTFWAKVPVTVPGQSEPSIVEMEYKHLTEDELAALDEQHKEKPLDERMRQRAFSIVCGWREVDGEFSTENLSRLMKNYPRAALDIFETYNRERYEARRKN